MKTYVKVYKKWKLVKWKNDTNESFAAIIVLIKI